VLLCGEQREELPAAEGVEASMAKHFGWTNVVAKEAWLRKTRLFSSLLAITLGIGAVVAIQSWTVVSKKAVSEKLDQLGANILVLPQGSSATDYYSADVDAPTFPEDYVERVATSMLPGVDNMSPKLSRKIRIGTVPVILTGILPKQELASKPIWQTSALMGAELQTACGTTGAGVGTGGTGHTKATRKAIDEMTLTEIWAGSLAARQLGLKQGSVLTVEGRPFTVTHILPETGTPDDDRVFAHLHAVQAILGTGSQVSAIEIMGCCSAISDGLLGKLRNILPDTRIVTIGNIVNTQIQTNDLMTKIAGVLLVVIVLVGSVSIGNYTWANVEERRREIGTLLTLGFRQAHIYYLFLSKAVLLALAGGTLGYAVGTVAAMVLGRELAGIWVPAVPILFLWSLVVATGISILGSWYPVHRAARIDPAVIMQEL
jgi:putative ABC transport system permease protein